MTVVFTKYISYELWCKQNLLLSSYYLYKLIAHCSIQLIVLTIQF